MRVKECAYDPIRDVSPVEPFGFIDLKEAFRTSTIPSNLPDSESSYNGIENPESILGKPSDVFEAMAMEHSINQYASENDKKDE